MKFSGEKLVLVVVYLFMAVMAGYLIYGQCQPPITVTCPNSLYPFESVTPDASYRYRKALRQYPDPMDWFYDENRCLICKHNETLIIELPPMVIYEGGVLWQIFHGR